MKTFFILTLLACGLTSGFAQDGADDKLSLINNILQSAGLKINVADLFDHSGSHFNALGTVIADIVMQQLGALEDPLPLIDFLSIPVSINDSITIDGEVNVTDVQISGLHGLSFSESIIRVIPLDGNIGFRLPEVKVTGNYKIDLLAMSIFPIPLEGEGPFSLDLSEIIFNGGMALKILPDIHFEITGVGYEVDVYKIWIRIDGLFTGVDEGQLNEAVNKVINSYATILFNLFEAELHDGILAAVMDIGNQILAELTLADIIAIIGSGQTTTTTTAPRLPQIN